MEIQNKIEAFRNTGTEQGFSYKQPFYYENDFIKLVDIQTSNKSGGADVKNGKQWSIIIKIKKDFTSFKTWKELQNLINIKLTPVRKSQNNLFGFRLYKMSKNPSNEIIKDILDYIFN